MMAGLPCPGAATKAAGGSARAKISRGSRRSSRPASSQIEKNSSAVTSCTAVSVRSAREVGSARDYSRSKM